MLTEKASCSHPGCRCALENRYVYAGDRAFCSANCADGIGCAHEACDCGAAKRHPPGFASFVHGGVRHLHRGNNDKR